MLLGFGWCHLQTSRESLPTILLETVDEFDIRIAGADQRLFRDFRAWMAAQDDPWLKWTLLDKLNYNNGLLTYCVDRNHRASLVWSMLDWINKNATGSYGLFYCHDDEDGTGRSGCNRTSPKNFANVFWVYRLQNGRLDELPNPFFGLIEDDLEPVNPDDHRDLPPAEE